MKSHHQKIMFKIKNKGAVLLAFVFTLVGIGIVLHLLGYSYGKILGAIVRHRVSDSWHFDKNAALTRRKTQIINTTEGELDTKENLHRKWLPYDTNKHPHNESYINIKHSDKMSYIYVDLLTGDRSNTCWLCGLGNKLFLIAITLGIAKQNDYFVILDNSAIKLTQLPNIIDNIFVGIPDAGAWKVLDYLKHFDEPFYQPEIMYELPRNETFVVFGTPMSYLYFKDIDPEIKVTFQLHDDLTHKMSNFLNTSPELGGASCVKIGVHIRHGDKVINQTRYKSPYHGYNMPDVSDVKFVLKQVAIRFKDKCHRFVIASDSKQYCKEVYAGENVSFSPFESAIEDFALLGECDHIIITQGTFSWWAGWFVYKNGGSVYYFKHPFMPNSRLGNMYKASDIYPTDWIPYTNSSVGKG